MTMDFTNKNYGTVMLFKDSEELNKALEILKEAGINPYVDTCYSVTLKEEILSNVMIQYDDIEEDREIINKLCEEALEKCNYNHHLWDSLEFNIQEICSDIF